jgi:hypothetical protein
VTGQRWNAPKVVLRGRHRDGDPLVLALCALGGFLLASAITLTGWDWSNVVMGVGSVLAFALAGRLRRGRVKTIKEKDQ